MKLTGHSQQLGKALGFIKELRPEYWVAIDPDLQAASDVFSLGTKLIVRHYSELYDFHPQTVEDAARDGVDAVLAAARFVTDCSRQSWFPFAWAVITPPAMVNNDSGGRAKAWAARFWTAMEHTLRVDHGKETIVGNWPNWNDGFFVPGLRRYGCQDYTYDAGSQSQLGKFRGWFDPFPADCELYVTEWGFTGLLAGYPDYGFRGHGDVQPLTNNYVNQAVGQMNYIMEQDSRYKTAAYFQFGAFDSGEEGKGSWLSHEGLDSIVEYTFLSLAAAPPVVVDPNNVIDEEDSTTEVNMARTAEQQNIIDFIDVNANQRLVKMQVAARELGLVRAEYELGIAVDELNEQKRRLELQFPN